jgi:hypothetical protein
MAVVRMRRGRSADDDLQGPPDTSSRYNPHALMSGRDKCSADTWMTSRPFSLSPNCGVHQGGRPRVLPAQTAFPCEGNVLQKKPIKTRHVCRLCPVLTCFVPRFPGRKRGGCHYRLAAPIRRTGRARVSSCNWIQIPLSISHTRRGVAGISMWRNPTRRWRASTIALMTAGGAPTAPASPAPFTPSGLAVEGTLWVEKAKNGTSSARGMA